MLAIIAAVAIVLMLAALLLKLKGFLMKHHLMVGALALAAVTLSGCAGSPFIRVNPDLSPEIQARQAETAQGFYKALGDRLQYCTIIGNIDLNLKMSSEAGLSNTAGLNCPARPWDQAPENRAVTPLSRMTVEADPPH